MKLGYKTDAEREQEEKEAAERLDYRFISSGADSSNSNKERNDEGRGRVSTQSMKEYVSAVNDRGREEEIAAQAGGGDDMDNSEQALALQRAERGKGMDDSETAMATKDEVAMQAKFYHWQDKYQPRKPRCET